MRRRTTVASAPSAAHTQTALGMPRIDRFTAKKCMAAVAWSCGAKPLVWTTINPWAMAFMPSVKIMEGTRR